LERDMNSAKRRAEVWERDGGFCGICGEPVDPLDWNLDHIVPSTLGGPDTEDNLRVTHPTCNRNRPIPRRMTDEQIAEAATEWTDNEFALDKYATFGEFVAAHLRGRAPRSA
jgi:5-methylcytosine-specific restriction endonuclease McrA